MAVLAGCSGRTTGATNIQEFVSRQEVSASADLNAIGSCSQSCTFFMRWRRVGAAAWTNGQSYSVGAVGSTRFHVTVEHLDLRQSYEYQACGKESGWSDFVCVGPDGTPNTTQKFFTLKGGGDWPQAGFDAASSRVNPWELTIDAGNVSKLQQAWFDTVRDAAAPSVANGTVYVGGRKAGSDTGIVAAYPSTCRIDGQRCSQPLWTADTGASVVQSAPAIGINRVFLAAEDGKVFALNATNGSPIWTRTTGGPISSAPMFDGGRVYVGSEDGKLYSFPWSCGDGPTPCPLWKASTFGAITSTPAAGPYNTSADTATVVVGSADHHVYTFNSTTGALIWTGLTGGPIHASPTVSNGVVYVGSDDGKLYAFPGDCVTQAGKCAPMWSVATGGPIAAAPAVDDPEFAQTVYVGSTDGRLYAYSAGCQACGFGGDLLWTATTGGPITEAVTVANGVVYVPSEDGKLYAYRAAGCGAATCAPLFTTTAGGGPTEAAISSGEVYFSDSSGVRAFTLP